MKKANKRVSKIFRIVLYLLAVFLFQEMAVRFCFPVPEISNFDRANYMAYSSGNKNQTHSRDLSLQWQSSPDTSAIFSHKMNRYGFSDDEWSIAKKTENRRFVFLGDSFVEGTMSTQDKTIPAGFLAASGGKNIEVFNAGILGQGLDAYLQLLVDMVPIFKPDVVFLCIYANDLGKQEVVIPSFFLEPEYFDFFTPRLIEMYRERRVRGPLRFRWNQTTVSYLPAVPSPANPWTENEPTLKNEISPELRNPMIQGTFNPFVARKLMKEEKYLKETPKLGGALSFFDYFCKEYQAQPVVVYIPSRNQVTDYYLPFEKQYCLESCPDTISLKGPAYQLPQKVISDQCKTLQVPFIDLTSMIREKETEGKHLYWNYDEHMRPQAYQMLGRAIWDALKSGK